LLDWADKMKRTLKIHEYYFFYIPWAIFFLFQNTLHSDYIIRTIFLNHQLHHSPHVQEKEDMITKMLVRIVLENNKLNRSCQKFFKICAPHGKMLYLLNFWGVNLRYNSWILDKCDLQYQSILNYRSIETWQIKSSSKFQLFQP
jgi:hypothetical protein